MNNKKLGTEFEEEFCKMLFDCGFWVHFMAPSRTGSQPCDVIACKNDIPMLFDCKTCKDDTFRISRLEDNQIMAFESFSKKGNRYRFVAVLHSENVYILEYEELKKLQKIKLNDKYLFERWVKEYELSSCN